MRFDDNSLEQRQIGDSDFTVRWLVDNLEKKDDHWKAISERATIKNVVVKGIGEGDGYISKIYLIKFEFDNGSSDAYSVVLKVPLAKNMSTLLTRGDNATGDRDLSFLENLAEYFHARECRFYNLYKENLIAVPKVFVAQKIIAGKQDGAILMENLANGARCATLFETFSMQQIERLAHQIAHLQAFSTTLSDEVLEEFHEMELGIPGLSTLYSSGIQKAIDLQPNLKPSFKRIEHLAKSLEFAKYSIYGIHKELGIRAVLIHNDMHFNNIFWKTNNDNSCSSELRAIIDWQIVRPGSPGDDLARLLLFCADPATRREAEAKIFDVYYDALTNELSSKNIAVPFTKEQAIVCYKRAFIGHFFFVVSLLTGFLETYKRTTTDATRVQEAKVEMLNLRIKSGLEDAVEILEKELPQWAQSSM